MARVVRPVRRMNCRLHPAMEALDQSPHRTVDAVVLSK